MATKDELIKAFATGKKPKGENFEKLINTVFDLEGEKGDSAYQVAINNGYSGEEEEWLSSLRGPQGEHGKDGSDGKQGPKGEDGKTPEGMTAAELEEGTSTTNKSISPKVLHEAIENIIKNF